MTPLLSYAEDDSLTTVVWTSVGTMELVLRDGWACWLWDGWRYGWPVTVGVC